MSGEPDDTGAATLTERFSLDALIDGLAADLADLRAGKITTRDAHARAALAKQMLRAVHYVITARRMIENRARTLSGNGGPGS